MSNIEFENQYWKSNDQKIVFRHKIALGLLDKGKTLDVGCGDGYFLNVLKNKGIECFGIDISNIAIEKCLKKGLQVKIFEILHNIPFEDNFFKNVLALDVLEHTYFPDKLLKEMIRVSSENIIISVPNFNSLPARLQVLFGNVPENNKPKKGHVYWFNYQNIKELLFNNNLEIIEIKVNTIWQNKKIINLITKLLLNLFPGIFSLSFVIKARKKKE